MMQQISAILRVKVTRAQISKDTFFNPVHTDLLRKKSKQKNTRDARVKCTRQKKEEPYL